MTKVKNFFLLISTLILGGVVLYAVKGGGQGTDTPGATDTYRIKVEYTDIEYVVGIEIIISNKAHVPSPIRLDRTGKYGAPIEADGEWTMDTLYRTGTGGILVDVHVSGANPDHAEAVCSIFRLRNGAEVERVAGPDVADNREQASCEFDRPGFWEGLFD
jgi:hypothetical protein